VYDLITVGLAFHWFDQPAFLREAAKVLKDGAWLVIFHQGFLGEMKEDPKFVSWARGDYLKQFPIPARRAVGIDAAMANSHGFEVKGHEPFSHEEVMTAEQFTQFLLTQSNIIAAVENGSTPLQVAAEWIAEGIAPCFGAERRTMRFGGTIWYLQK
jgi:hypothetical protein